MCEAYKFSLTIHTTLTKEVLQRIKKNHDVLLQNVNRGNPNFYCIGNLKQDTTNLF